MTDAEKKDLIKRLGAKSNRAFDDRYSEDNRKWFVEKIIESLPWKTTAAADIEKQTKVIIDKSGAEVKARVDKGVSAASLKDKWARLDQKASRTQIIYGMIGMYPEFLLAPNADYFDFILERRFRSIQRMAFSVNPNDERNIFDYPDSSKKEKMKVNKDATGPPPASPIWFGIKGGTIPFILTGRGKSDPDTAVETLFKVNTGSDRNLFFCDPVATILHMDALRAAKDPNKLLNALISVGDHYLKIDHPDGHFGSHSDGQVLVGVTSAQATAGSNADIKLGNIGQVLIFIQKQLTAAALTTDSFISFQGPDFTIVQEGVNETFKIDKVNPVSRVIRVGTLKNSFRPGAKVYVTRGNLTLISTLPHHFISDSRPDHALFEQVTIKSADLQVGDHVYVLNHPIYKVFYPSGVWGGEHSFISEIDSRDSTSSVFRNAIKVGGHGLLNTTLLGMIDEMLEWNNTVLAILQSLTQIHLGNLKKNGRPSADTTVSTGGFKFKFIKRNESGRGMNVFEYSMPYKYSVILRGKSKTFNTTTGFVIKEVASDPDKAFQVWQHDGTDSITVPPIELRVIFTGAGAAEQFMLSKWAMAPFFNSQTVHFDTQPLFKSDNKTPNPLTFDDIVKSKPMFVTDDNGDAFVTRPRVDFRATYQTFLKTNGAI
jgi:hypothetical protein